MSEAAGAEPVRHPLPRGTDLAAARLHARRVVEDSGSSFFSAMRILARPRREAMYAIYAFCREVDDIADREGPLEDKRRDLGAWREEVDRLYEGRPTRPTAIALKPAVESFNLPKAEFVALLDGMEMDAREAMVGPPMDELLLYCRRVAGAVGLLSIHVFGDASPPAQDLAIAEGEALQLTNILRDLAEDAGRGRLYLPAEFLAAQGLCGLPPQEVLHHPGLPAVCRELARIAQQRFAESRGLLRQCDRRRLRPAVLMLEVYSRILERLEAGGWQQPTQRVSLPKALKLWLVLRHGLI